MMRPQLSIEILHIYRKNNGTVDWMTSNFTSRTRTTLLFNILNILFSSPMDVAMLALVNLPDMPKEN